MDGQGFSREVAFSQSVINIGADQGNDIVLRGSSVADFHVLMHYDSGHWSISPLNGDYRTTVNGRSLGLEGTVLQNGSIVEIGTYRLTMMLNGVNTDIVIQSQGSADSSMESDSTGSDRNIQLEITKMDQTELEAGTAAEIELTVTNAGPLVANMQLQLQGIPSAWVQIIPPVLNLNEGRKGTFLVRISPPRSSSAEAGLYSLHFVAISPNYPRNTGIADTSITILPYSEFLISGPTPMQLKLSHGKPTDIADFVIINNSNAVGTYFVQSRDDSNELNFAYQKTGGSGLAAGQEMVTVRPGDSVQIPMEVTAKKIPLLGVSSKHHHYYTNVAPTDRPGDTQTIAGEVTIKPAINTMLLLLLLVVLLIAVGFIFQPYIHSFECQEGRRNQVIVAGSSAQLSWNVSRFATTITLNNGQTDTEVSNNGNLYVSPTVSTSYTLTAENFISSLLHITHKKTVQVLVVPSRPAIDVFSVDKGKALYDETVTLNWSVEPNATAASITTNKSTSPLAAENYTGKLAQGYQTDSLISLKAQNDSGYDLKSVFINVASDNISLVRFTVWVRPNGIAVPEDNDVRRNTRWGSLQLTGGTTQPARSGASGVNPQPAAQSNTLEIPDNFSTVGFGTQNLNPEVMAASGQTMPSTGTYSYQPPTGSGSGAPAELLVSPSMNPTPVPTAAATAAAADSVIVRSAPAPVTSPEGSSSNRDFTIKLAEVIEDPLADSGYRVIEYFPDYVLQKQEQILVEWNVDGVSKVKIENLSGDDLQNIGNEYAYPEKSTTYTLTAQAGETKKAYSLPVNVAGDADNGQGSGLNCDLKANATTLKVPGSVMLTWTGGGNNRVQLISSTQAEKENADAEKKKEEEAKAKGEKYEQPKQNQPLTGGTIGDYLQPSGFMRVNVDKQTTFVLNAYDASNNVICTKSVEVKYEGGNDKKDIKLKITKIADENGVSQPVYGKGQMVSYTVALTDFVKGTDPTGAIAITDGTSTCSVNWPVNTCSFQAKKTGELTITAVYAGDDVYKKATATAKETVVDKMPTSTQINSAIKPAGDKADVDVELLWDAKHSYGMVPGGTVTLTAGSTSCDVDLDTETMTCAGEVTVNTVRDDGSISISVKNMGLKDATPDRVTAAYKGDAYFRPSTSQSVLFRKVNTQISIVNDKEAKIYPYKPDENHANLETLFSWVVKTDDKGDPVWGRTAVNGYTPTGTISFILTDNKAADYGKCEYDLSGKKFSCEGTVTPGDDAIYDRYLVKEMLLANPAADRVRAEYSGDSLFNASKSTTVLFAPIEKIPTTLELRKVAKSGALFANATADLTWDDTASDGKRPTGTITFTIGTGGETCVYTMDSGVFTCLEEGQTSITTYEDTDGIFTGEFIKMLLKTTGADRIKAAYSGDSYFEKSETNYYGFEKIDPNLTITKVTDDEGKEHQWYKPEQKGVRVYIDMPGAVAGTDPTGPVTIRIDSETCTITYPQDFCSLNLTKVKGDLTVTATYGGDDIYLSGKTDYPVKVQDPQPLKLEITRIADHEDQKQDEYSKSDEIKVTVKLSGYATEELPTGDITVKLGPSDSNSCKIAMPTDTMPTGTCQLTSPDADGNYQLTAEYAGNSWYDKASAEPEQVKISNYAIDFEIVSITNNRTDTTTGKYITQPYYVFDPDKDPAPGEGQEVRICVKFSNYEHGAPDKDKYISVGDFDHEDTHDLASFKVGTENKSCGTFKVKKYTSTITLTAKFPGDGNYVIRTATKTMDVQNRIQPELLLFPAIKSVKTLGTGEILFAFRYDHTIPDQYKGVNPFIDNAEDPEGANYISYISFNFKSVSGYTCKLDLSGDPKITQDSSCLNTGTKITPMEFGDFVLYSIEGVIFPSGLTEDSEITANYGGNTYFYGVDEQKAGVVEENGYFTNIYLSDVLRYDDQVDDSKAHAFFTALMTYDKASSDKPTGSLFVNDTECPFNLNAATPTFNCGTVTEVDGGVSFVFKNITVNSTDTGVTVKYNKTGSFNGSSAYAVLNSEGPVIVDKVSAKRISKDTADVAFTFKDFETLTKKYEVLDAVRFGSKCVSTGTSTCEDTTEKTCTYSLTDYSLIDGTCSVESFDKDGDSYSISGLTGIIEKEHTTFTVTLVSTEDYLPEAELPKDLAKYSFDKIPTTLTVRDVLKYFNTHGFLMVNLNYDEERAEAIDEYPRGLFKITINDSDGGNPKTCHYDLSEPNQESEDCAGSFMNPHKRGSDGEYYWRIANFPVRGTSTQLTVSYDGDGVYYDGAPMVSTTYKSETPLITILDATKTSDGVYTTFKIDGIGELTELYFLDKRLRLESNNGGKTCDYSLLDEEFSEGCSGEFSQNGNTFIMKQVKDIFQDGDTALTVYYATPDYNLQQAEFPKDKEDYTKHQTEMAVSDVLKVGNMIYLTAEMGFADLPADNYGLVPTGKLTLSTDGTSGQEKSCSFDIAAETFGCGSISRSGNSVTFIVSGQSVPTDATSVTVKYNGDDVYLDSDNSGAIKTEDVNITIHSAKKTNKNNHGYMAFTIPELDTLSKKYEVYPQFRISSKQGASETGACVIDRVSLKVVEGCTLGSIERKSTSSGDLIIIKDFSGVIQDDSDILTAALVNGGESFFEKPESITEFSVKFTVSTDPRPIKLLNLPDYNYFVDMIMEYDQDEDIANYYKDLKPDGTVRIQGTPNYFDAKIGQTGCNSSGWSEECKEWDFQSGYKLHYQASGINFGNTTTVRPQYLGDDIFPATNGENTSITGITAKITIQDAKVRYNPTEGAHFSFEINNENFRLMYKYKILTHILFQFVYSKGDYGTNSKITISDAGTITFEKPYHNGKVTHMGDNVFKVENLGNDPTTYLEQENFTRIRTVIHGDYWRYDIDKPKDEKPLQKVSTVSSFSASPVTMSLSLGGQ